MQGNAFYDNHQEDAQNHHHTQGESKFLNEFHQIII